MVLIQISVTILFPLLTGWKEDVWYVLQSWILWFEIWRPGRARVCLQRACNHEAGGNLSQAGGKMTMGYENKIHFGFP